MMFDGWFGLLRVLVSATLGYVALIVTLRSSGKRTLSKMNAFDLVVTVALGSSFATMILSKDVAVLEGVTAFVVLALLQYVVAAAASRSTAVQRLVKASPALLFYRGKFLDDVLTSERVTQSDVRAAVRAAGLSSMEDVEAVVLETAGDLSVTRRGGDRAGALTEVMPPGRG